jgi:hypothetical protein
MVQHLDNEQGLGLIVAVTREAADKLAVDMTTKKGSRVSVTEVGTVQGETLAKQIAFAVVRHKITGVFVTDDGETLYFFKAPPIPG